MNEEQTNPDRLKPLAAIHCADPRSNNQAVLDIFKPGADALAEHHAAVAEIRLDTSVPEDVVEQFETSKNLYLYAWFVYRFYPVAEHHALTCLELGLRLRFAGQLPEKDAKGRQLKHTLWPLLKFAVDTGAIRNEGFRQWRDQVDFRARQRYAMEKREEMFASGLHKFELDYTQVEPNEEDREWDYLSRLQEVLPKIRNCYAHGSTLLHQQVLGTLELVSEILNQLFHKAATDS
jgi:hypothetical protein